MTMQRVQLNHASGVPVFRQVIDQIVFMIEGGELQDGDRLPASRLLASNLGVNRNTTARAYAELHRLGYVSSQGSAGMVVRRSDQAREQLARRTEAVAALAEPVRRCLELGLSADEIAMIAYQQCRRARQSAIEIAFVECNEERSKAFAAELGDALKLDVRPFVLDSMTVDDVADADLVVTTFFHFAEVRRVLRTADPATTPDVLAIVAAPHIKTLARLARIQKDRRIGILYSTDDQAEAIRQSLSDTGLGNVTVLHDGDDPAVDACDVVVVPSENPELVSLLKGRTRVVEFGNVLDPASIRMVAEMVGDLQERKGKAVDEPALPDPRGRTRS